MTKIATDAFGNALGSSLAETINSSDYMQTMALRSTINAERASRGLDPFDSGDSDSMDAIRGMVAAQRRGKFTKSPDMAPLRSIFALIR